MICFLLILFCRNTSVEDFYRFTNDSRTQGYYYLNDFSNIMVSGGRSYQSPCIQIPVLWLININNWLWSFGYSLEIYREKVMNKSWKNEITKFLSQNMTMSILRCLLWRTCKKKPRTLEAWNCDVSEIISSTAL